jgi:hypothetical protein
MKSALALLVVLLGCSVSHKSQEYVCTTQNDCADHPNTVCQQGFCIVPGSIDAPGRSDAPRDGSGGGQCPSGCTSCNLTQKTCTMDCSQEAGFCQSQVSCPTGFHCDIQCNSDNACRSGVTCTAGASCTITCSGNSSCRGVQCGAGPCDVTCSGPSSCRDVSCGNSCACDVLCTGSQSCAQGISCTSLLCSSGLGCSSVQAGCHSCM